MTQNDPIEARLDLARTIAREAGDVTLRYYQRPDLAVERKSDASPVTAADRDAETLLRQRIAGAFPDDAILGEEFGATEGTSGFRWILDPIDGTKSFICGVPLYTTLIGVEHADQSVIGVIHAPALDETAWGATGHGAWYSGGGRPPAPARVSTKKSLAGGVFLTSQVDLFDVRGARHVFDRLQAIAGITRTWGDAYGYLLVATGRAEAMVDAFMNVWDAAALLPILEEAGGTYTDWNGQRTILGGEGVATNGHVLQEVLTITKSRTDL
jgi:histidinol phosphatase-like enzyme (inositol monophosphatase family)